MGLKRQCYTRQGQNKQSKTYTGNTYDHQGVMRHFSLFTEKKASAEALRKIQRLVILRQNHEGPDRELTSWIEAIPPKLRDQLGKYGILSAGRVAGAKAIHEHIEDWRAALGGNGASPQYCKEAPNRVKRIANESGWRMLSDSSRDSFECWKVDQRAEGMANNTINTYIQSIKAFFGWLKEVERIRPIPWTEGVAKLNAAVDIRRARAALSVADGQHLLTVTRVSKKRIHGMNGIDRAILYLVALASAFRWSELYSLTCGSFDLSGDYPHCRVGGEITSWSQGIIEA